MRAVMGMPKGAAAMVQRGDDSSKIQEPEIEPAGAGETREGRPPTPQLEWLSR